MDQFLSKHMSKIHASLSFFDRVIFKGHLPLGWSEAIESFLSRKGILIKDLKNFTPIQAERIKDHAMELAAKHDRLWPSNAQAHRRQWSAA